MQAIESGPSKPVAANGYHSLMKWRPPESVVTVLTSPRWLLAFAVCLSAAAPLHAQTSQELRRRALELAYNLDHDQALEMLRRSVAIAPDDPAPHRSLASVLWLNLLFRRGSVTVDHYLGSFSRSQVDLGKPPPEIDREFRTHVERAISLAEKQIAANPRDVQAHYDLGVALGLQASYVATVEGKGLAGLRAARRAYDEQEKVLELDPSRTDAGLIIGTYRYLVSTLSLPMRMVAYVVGFGGGRERGVQMLEKTAAIGSHLEPSSAQADDSRTDAMFALVLVYNREHRFDDALKVLQELRRLYPRNRLLLLEAGSTALRGGRFLSAEEMLTEGLTMLANERRPRIPGEESLWRFKRGKARAALGKTEAALADLQFAGSAEAQPWVHGRARVEVGRLALQRGDRTAAAGEARQAEALCERGNDPPCVQDARALLRSSGGR
jgi:tetratricopeptide (TPR) repeat protein